MRTLITIAGEITVQETLSMCEVLNFKLLENPSEIRTEDFWEKMKDYESEISVLQQEMSLVLALNLAINSNMKKHIGLRNFEELSKNLK